MNNTYEKLIEKIKSYNPKADFELIKSAYTKASNMHKTQKRVTGEPYIVHPLEVAIILAEMELDTETIIAGLLHDVVEDTPVSTEDVRNEFGDAVALMVEGVTKLDKIQFSNKEEQQIESLRKMFLAMAKDVRVILIKLADRLHNMRTLENVPTEKRLLKARETLEVYAPLAHRLGISAIKSELEDLSLRYLDSVAYYEIAEGIKKKKSERIAYITAIKETLSDKLAELPFEFEIEGRAKSFYSIFKKMYEQNKNLEEIYDLFAIRIIVQTVNDCYAVLGLVHEMYVPIPGRFKDYIAMPKPNMYQSLHTTVMGPEGTPFEIQIRTFEMHKVAERGIAAHWQYKEGKSGANKSETDSKLEWIRQLLEIQKDLNDADEFMRALKIDLFAGEVFVFTPRGDVINLPSGSTTVDFAFAIHSAVGNKMVGAKVNSKIVTLDYQLKTGDIVEVLTSSNVHGPSRDWLKICKTSQAKSKINQWFKKEKREENIEAGKEMMEREAKRLGITLAELMKSDILDPCLKKYGFSNTDDMYAALGYGNINANKIVSRLREVEREKIKLEQKVSAIDFIEKPVRAKHGNNIVVEGINNCLVRVARCCTPLPGDEIIGFITRGRGVSVHRSDCINISPDKLSTEEAARIINCHWEDEIKGRYLSDVMIESTDRSSLLADIINAVGEYRIPITTLNSRVTKKHTAVIFLTVEIASAEQLDSLIKRLYTISGVYNITRTHK